MNYEIYAQKAIDKLQLFQNQFKEKYDVDNFEDWFYNQSTELLRLSNTNKELYLKYIPVGTYSRKTNTWMWSWANENSVETSKYDTLKIKEFGSKNNYSNLITAHFDGDEYTGWELTAITFVILGGIGTYRVISEHLEIYFLITEIVSKEYANDLEMQLIECDLHGQIRPAFICQHLNKTQKTGFEEAFATYLGMKLEEDDDLLAWCNNCERERLKTDGWNEASMSFAKIKLVCERCYFEIKDFNLY